MTFIYRYGYHPVYLESREDGDSLRSHVVAYQNTAGLDVIMRRGLIQYRALGGTFDFRFMSGDAEEDNDSDSDKGENGDNKSESKRDEEASKPNNSPQTAIEQYVQYSNLPIMVPRWSLGFHMLRWGYKNTSMVREVHQAMLDHGIPLEVMWSDIDHMQSERSQSDRIETGTRDPNLTLPILRLP